MAISTLSSGGVLGSLKFTRVSGSRALAMAEAAGARVFKRAVALPESTAVQAK
jgi:hypothetical protein